MNIDSADAKYSQITCRLNSSVLDILEYTNFDVKLMSNYIRSKRLYEVSVIKFNFRNF